MRNRYLFPENSEEMPDLYTFQESHSSPAVERFWNTVLPGQVSFSHGTSQSRGVILGIHSRSSLTLKSSFPDPAGRYIIAECMKGEELFTVVSVYFEPQISPDLFLDELVTIAKKVDELGHNRVLWVGDFNIALNPQLDTTATSLLSRCGTRSKVRELLLPFLEEHDLTDAWRAMHPVDVRYTVRSKLVHNKVVHTRADFFLVSPALLTSVVETDIKASFSSDHNPITMNFFLGGPNVGRGYWKFPDFLLSDENFKSALQTQIKETLFENPDTEPGLLWDTIKTGIRGLAIEYLARSKRIRKQKIKLVEQKLAVAASA